MDSFDVRQRERRSVSVLRVVRALVPPSSAIVQAATATEALDQVWADGAITTMNPNARSRQDQPGLLAGHYTPHCGKRPGSGDRPEMESFCTAVGKRGQCPAVNLQTFLQHSLERSKVGFFVENIGSQLAWLRA